ncbi:GTPase ObgE [Litorilinea aerophila]|uniref:GTPase Obg n=1 Tax=Litorilinea aerophila TaxID=1204385 RepID=A0A540VF84_9CHLR|nr:GTPase ObgE [Litorilinea aerophila]MCC9076942.1 GTPase ObgE [Litorilinea aerophila]
MFFDRARIYVKGGDGGNGVVAFRREKFVPRGGPAGGSGGRGGHVYLVVDPELNTLYPFQNQVHFRAERGGHGSGANKTGATGADLRIPVPPGTLVRDAETGEVLADLTRPGQEVLVARGGRGGRGNVAFKSSRNQTPRLAEKGEAGQERWLELELKLVADVGIVGVPNAGKSTLLSVVSAAKPKIADYPFTTVVPNLGVAEVDHRQMVLADIPGLLEGAHDGVGLGLEFLRHIERTRVLIHLLNGASPDPLGDFEAINQELVLFNPALADKPQIVVLNKMDLPEAQAHWPAVEAHMERLGLPVMHISAVTGQNVTELLRRVQQMLDALPPLEVEEEPLPELTPEPDEKAFQIHRLAPDVWQVKGIAIERAAQMTNWDYYEAAMRFQRILAALGIRDALREAGINEGDTVRIGDVELIWGYDNAYDT